MYNKIPGDDLLDDLSRVNGEVEGSATIAEYRELGEFSYQTITDHFGSWHAAQELVGCEAGYAKVPDGEALADLERVNQELGHAATQDEYSEYGRFSHTTLCNCFGSWKAAQAKAGYDIANRVKHTKSNIFTDVVDVTEELGRGPLREEYDDLGIVCTSTVADRLGGWTKARMRAWRVWQEVRGGRA